MMSLTKSPFWDEDALFGIIFQIKLLLVELLLKKKLCLLEAQILLKWGEKMC